MKISAPYFEKSGASGALKILYMQELALLYILLSAVHRNVYFLLQLTTTTQ